MAGIKGFIFYKSKICGNCGYSWSFPVIKEDMLTNKQKLYLFYAECCPTCGCVAKDITKAGQEEKIAQKDENYKRIVEKRNLAFSYVSNNESYIFELLAYLCEKRQDLLLCAKSYFMAYLTEKEQREKYINSLSYNEEKDGGLIKNSLKQEKEYFALAENRLQTYLAINSEDVKANLLLAYMFSLQNDKKHTVETLNYVAKMKITKKDVQTIREIMGEFKD
jgi:thioredoxin-like negative regulator of GroEL